MELVSPNYRLTLADVQADPSLRERITTNDLHCDAGLLRHELENLFEGREHGLGWLPNTTGYRPRFPMVGEVWSNRGVCPYPNDGSGHTDPEYWAQAWAVLQRLHAEYEASREAEPDAVGESTIGPQAE